MLGQRPPHRTETFGHERSPVPHQRQGPVRLCVYHLGGASNGRGNGQVWRAGQWRLVRLRQVDRAGGPPIANRFARAGLAVNSRCNPDSVSLGLKFRCRRVIAGAAAQRDQLAQERASL